jgi:exopolyphosphatase/pppGpp-phosphohydrolase
MGLRTATNSQEFLDLVKKRCGLAIEVISGDEECRIAYLLVGMGGAVTNIAAVTLGLAKYDPEKVQGAVIDRTEIDRQIELYRAIPAEERRQIAGLQPKRAEVILAGACIVRTIMDKLEKPSLRVSDRGLRHGILIDRFGGHPDGFGPQPGRLRLWEP